MKPKRFRDLKQMPAETFKKFHGVSKSEFQSKQVKEENEESSLEEASSAAVKLQKAFQREQEKTQRERKAGEEFMNKKEDGQKSRLKTEETDTSEKTEMAQTQLHFIKYAAEEILEYIEMGGEIEEWYQNKLSKVQSEVESLHSYVEGESRRTGMKEDVEQLEEGRPSQRHPLEGHEYHKKTNAELEYIAKDAHKAAEAMKSHNTTAENKYRDQANDSATVRYYRQKNGMQPWYKKKYGHVNEETVNEGNGYDDNRTGFAKKPREDDEGHAPTKFKAKDPMNRPHTVHIDGKPWKKFDNGHQANAAVSTLSAKGKKATAIAHYKEENMQEEVKDDTPPFDGPYKKTSKVVTDKSGAKHSPMSRVRDLARKAAQRASTPAKLKESDSRKAAIVKGAAKGKKKTSSDDAFQAEPQLSSTITKNY